MGQPLNVIPKTEGPSVVTLVKQSNTHVCPQLQLHIHFLKKNFWNKAFALRSRKLPPFFIIIQLCKL